MPLLRRVTSLVLYGDEKGCLTALPLLQGRNINHTVKERILVNVAEYETYQWRRPSSFFPFLNPLAQALKHFLFGTDIPELVGSKVNQEGTFHAASRVGVDGIEARTPID
jgi:hypothetical protein